MLLATGHCQGHTPHDLTLFGSCPDPMDHNPSLVCMCFSVMVNQIIWPWYSTNFTVFEKFPKCWPIICCLLLNVNRVVRAILMEGKLKRKFTKKFPSQNIHEHDSLSCRSTSLGQHVKIILTKAYKVHVIRSLYSV